MDPVPPINAYGQFVLCCRKENASGVAEWPRAPTAEDQAGQRTMSSSTMRRCRRVAQAGAEGRRHPMLKEGQNGERHACFALTPAWGPFVSQ